ncbi:MAG: FimB/Mfa2 family fimbrial subunit [Bacteroides sp.]|nr:FimB/Mfa2 family fimbrial subunit [Bacteroides sp.]
MTIKGIIPASWRLLILFMITGLLRGCIKENLDDCRTHCILHVRAFDATGTELTSNEVSSVALYLFDDNKRLTGTLQTQIGQHVKIEPRMGENIHIVAWGNLGENTLPKLDENYEDCTINIRQRTRAEVYAIPPDDLFQGMISIHASQKREEKELPVYRKVGSLTLTARNLKEFAGFQDDDYTVVIRETYSSIHFNGTLTGQKVSYLPDGRFVSSDGREYYYVAPFTMIPEETGLYIDIYYQEELIMSIGEDGQGKPITVREGMLTHVLLDFNRLWDITVVLSEWDDQYNYDKEF